ncbi:MAG: hypothetical protein V3T98_01565 [Candidatus Paceibacterota bacterium]
MKKSIIIISVILGILALAGGVYFAWKKSQEILTPPTSPIIPTFPTTPTIPTSPTSNLKIISDQPVFDYFVRRSLGEGGLATSTEIFYIAQDGKIFKIIENTEDEIISSQIIDNLQQVKSSSNGERILIKSGSANSPQFNIFNAADKIWELLPSGITAADFSPDNKKIAYLKTNGDKNDLITKNISGTRTTKIISLSQKDFGLKWLTTEIILLIPKPSFQINADIWEVNTKNKTIKKIASGRGLMVNWSTNGDLGMKFSVDQRRNSYLDLIDNEGVVQANFDFSTLPDKCLFNLAKIYCAIPQAHNSIQEPVLPDDYLKRAVYFEDFIYEMNLEQNTFEVIYAEPELAIDAFRLSTSNNQLLFINRYDDKLYSLVIE